VLDPLHPLAEKRAREVVASGVRHFKIKCGRDAQREHSYVRDLARLTPLPKLRLDPNRAWDREAALSFVDGLRDVTVEWIEDPTLRLEEWSQIAQTTGIAIAVDEPLCEEPKDDVIERSGAGLVILKPMALGGFTACLGWARRALRLGIPVSISHLFDGPVALEACAHLAFAIQSRNHAPGLGNHAALDGYAALGLARPDLLRPGHLAAPSATIPGAR
jgi:L-alanine-DL-glutamate epimerase-like enolase superfamily enzyme